MDRWLTKNVIASGGLVLSDDVLEQGDDLPGSGRVLVNYEPAASRGYRKISGYLKYDEAQVPGDDEAPILMATPAMGRVFAAREDDGSFDIHESFQSGWTKINTDLRPNDTNKVRLIRYTMATDRVCIVDGANRGLVYDGTSDTLLDTTDAPTAPVAVEYFNDRLAFAQDSILTLTAPSTDTDFTAGNGALVFNVGQPIIGLTLFREVLYIFCENSIKKLAGNVPENFIIQNVTTQIGCINADTIQEIGGDIVYLAPDGVRSLAATERIGDIELGVQSRAIDVRLEEMFETVPASFCSCTIPSKSQYRLFYYQSGVDADSQLGFLGRYDSADKIAIRNPILNSSNFQWSQILGFPAYSSGNYFISGQEISVFGHITDGYVYRTEVGGSRDGDVISFEWRTPPYKFEDINLRKVIQRIRAIIEARQATGMSVRLILDEYENETIQPTAKILTIASSSLIYNNGENYDSGAVYSESGSEFLISRKLEGSGKTITFVFNGSNTDLSHQINSFTIEYALKGRR